MCASGSRVGETAIVGRRRRSTPRLRREDVDGRRRRPRRMYPRNAGTSTTLPRALLMSIAPGLSGRELRCTDHPLGRRRRRHAQRDGVASLEGTRQRRHRRALPSSAASTRCRSRSRRPIDSARTGPGADVAVAHDPSVRPRLVRPWSPTCPSGWRAAALGRRARRESSTISAMVASATRRVREGVEDRNPRDRAREGRSRSVPMQKQPSRRSVLQQSAVELDFERMPQVGSCAGGAEAHRATSRAFRAFFDREAQRHEDLLRRGARFPAGSHGARSSDHPGSLQSSAVRCAAVRRDEHVGLRSGRLSAVRREDRPPPALAADLAGRYATARPRAACPREAPVASGHSPG